MAGFGRNSSGAGGSGGSDGCAHPVQVAGLCAVCGKELDSAALSGTSIVMSHSSAGIKVSASEAQRLDLESTAKLLSERRLALIIDLDQTIIHATVDPTVGDWMTDPANPNYAALRTVGRFKLGMDGKSVLDIETPAQILARTQAVQSGERTPSPTDLDAAGCWYYVKPRPGLSAFLHELNKKYELHVYTMGTRSYADCVCKLVDPDGTLFGSRILSRDENGSLLQKSLARLFPVDTSMVVIIDDRSDVWNRSPNLIKVIPYDFFVGIGDINGTFLPPAPSSTPGGPDDEAETPAEVAAAPISDDGSGGAASSAASTSSDSAEGLASPASASSAPTTVAASAAEDEEEATPAQATANKQAEEKAEKEQRAVITEQVDRRPLAKMQEALEEKLAHKPAGAHTVAQPAAGKPHPPDGQGSAAAQAVVPESAVQQADEDEEEDEEEAEEEDYEAFTLTHAVLRDDDHELDRVQGLLADIHRQWYSQWDLVRSDWKTSPQAAAKEQSKQKEMAVLREMATKATKPAVMVSVAPELRVDQPEEKPEAFAHNLHHTVDHCGDQTSCAVRVQHRVHRRDTTRGAAARVSPAIRVMPKEDVQLTRCLLAPARRSGRWRRSSAPSA